MIDRVIFIRYIEETEPPWDQGNVPWIIRILVRWAMTVLAFIVAEWFVNAIWEGKPVLLEGADGYLLAPAIFVAVRAVFRPILIFLTCPLQIITLGLFILVVNALIVLLVEEVCDWFSVAFDIDGFWAAFGFALVVSAVTFGLSRLLRRSPFATRRRLF
jgi:putative membrane protein